MKFLANAICFCILGVILAACGGASAATDAPTATPWLTIPPTAVVPTPDIGVYSGMDLVGGDPQQGLNVAIAFQCKGCHDGTLAEKGPRFTATDNLPPILERGELRIGDPAYEGQAATDLDYILESIFIPEVHMAPGEWAVTMPDDFAGRIEEEELSHLLAWMQTFGSTAETPVETAEPQAAEEVQAAADPQRGREIFFNGGAHESYQQKFACTTCHSLDGTVSGEDASGPSLLGVADRAGERVPGLSAEEYIRESIVDPAAFLTPTYRNGMTKFGGRYLSAEELDDLIAFLLTLRGEEVPEVDIRPTPEVDVDLGISLEEGNAARGRQLPAVTYRCAGCHANDEIAGYGPPFVSTDDLPPIRERGELRISDPAYEGRAATNEEYLLESILVPAVYIVPGEWKEKMPNAFHMVMSDQELADILAWLETFE
jgi:mono/diheme cytochrome c family protein